MNRLLDTAIAAAEAGGATLRAMAADFGTVRVKSSSVDFVTEADLAAGVAAVRAIAQRVEGARFVVEEPEVYALAGVPEGSLDDEEVWVVDPLDGTTSFVHGYPCYSTSVACLHDGQPTAGAVHNVPLRETTSASVGEGAWLDGVRLQVTAAASIEEALLITGFPYDRGETLDKQMRVFARIILTAHDIRRDGSAAIDCCHVAAGRADGFWEFGLQPWDTAAGVVALREAGAIVSGIRGEPWTVRSGGIIAANPVLHAALAATIAA
jgi:myo-inositol-1(or 4)-monophosphatase